MIRNRLLCLGVMIAAAGWQLAFGKLGSPSAGAAAVVIAAGAALIVFAAPRHRLAAAAAVLVAQGLLAPPAVALFARWHRLPGIEHLLAAGARLLGADAAASDGRVVIQTGERLIDVLPSLSRAGDFFVLMMLAGFAGVALLVPIAKAGAWLARAAAVTLGWTLLRLFALIVLKNDLPEHGLETSGLAMLLSFAPAALLLPRVSETAAAETVRLPRRLAALAAATGVAWSLAIGWADVGTPKRGRIVFDDSRGPWEPTDTPFDTKSYGQRFAYAYSSLYRLLEWHYDVRRVKQGPVDDRVLADADVLVVKTPVQPFAPGEIDAIERFVARGGGLFLIGDHTNLFGMTTYLNALAERFGVRFAADDTFSLRTEGQSQWRASRWLAHPLARQIGEFEFETSCTLDVPLRARAPIVGTALGADPADYSRPGFFGNLHLDGGDDYGWFVQHAVLEHGRGRVAAFSDSTPLSNFSLFFPGRRELAVSTVEWLNRRATPARHVPLGATLLSVAGVFLLVRGGAARHGAHVASTLAIGFAAGVLLVRATSGSVEPPPMRKHVPTVAFERATAKAVLPSVLTVDGRDDHAAMDSLLVAAQRLGYFPRVSDALARGLGAGDAVVLVYPDELPSERIEELTRFVARGGSLLVIAGLLDDRRGAERIAQAFGLGFDLAVERTKATREAAGDLPILRPVLAVRGGTPVLTDSAQRVLFAVAPMGRGRIGVLAESLAVSKTALGARFSGDPNGDQKQSLELAYFVLRRLVENRGAVTTAAARLP